MISLEYKLPKMPKDPTRKWRLKILTALNKTGRGMKKDFKRSTTTWNTKPKFEWHKSFAKNVAEVNAGTNDPVYAVINDGRKGVGHLKPFNYKAKGILVPGKGGKIKQGKALKFPRHSVAKTVPGKLDARKGERSEYIYRKSVRQPDIKARNFDTSVLDIWEDKFVLLIEKAVDEILEEL